MCGDEATGEKLAILGVSEGDPEGLLGNKVGDRCCCCCSCPVVKTKEQIALKIEIGPAASQNCPKRLQPSLMKKGGGGAMRVRGNQTLAKVSLGHKYSAEEEIVGQTIPT